MSAAEILEAAMLVCFGFSWPMSVLKNIRAKSAKNMSLPFILLICSGYIAGIASKIITHNISYVLLVYLINLAIVSANIAVYFINRRLDKKKAKTIAIEKTSEPFLKRVESDTPKLKSNCV